MILILVVILLILALGGMPSWGYHSYGWGPSGVVGLILVVVVIVWLLGGRF